MGDPNLELQEAGWEELRKEARKIEGDLDVKLSSYAKLGSRFTQGGGIRLSNLITLLISIWPRTLADVGFELPCPFLFILYTIYEIFCLSKVLEITCNCRSILIHQM